MVRPHYVQGYVSFRYVGIGGTGNDVALTLIPESASTLLLALGGLILLAP